METDPRLPSLRSTVSPTNTSSLQDRTSAQLSLGDDPNEARNSFLKADYDRALPHIRERFPFVQPLYITKIYRSRLTARGLVWLDHDREDMTPVESHSLSHLLYCFEIYAQILCMFATDSDGPAQAEELQRALADYRIRLLKLVKGHTFDSLKLWHEAFLDEMMEIGQDNPRGWRAAMPGLTSLLRRRMMAPSEELNGKLDRAALGKENR